MIPQEVAELCRVLDEDFDARTATDPFYLRTLNAAWRVYNAGYRKPE